MCGNSALDREASVAMETLTAAAASDGSRDAVAITAAAGCMGVPLMFMGVMVMFLLSWLVSSPVTACACVSAGVAVAVAGRRGTAFAVAGVSVASVDVT